VVEVVVTTIVFDPRTFAAFADTTFAVNLRLPMTLASFGRVKVTLFVVPALLSIVLKMTFAVLTLVTR
jgi:hypothetical protein